MKAPRALLSEIVAESRLTGRLFLVVEGESDRRFIEQWLLSAVGHSVEKLSILTPDGVDVTWDHLASVGLSEGAKQRVVYIGLHVPSNFPGLTCIADLDCGLLADRHKADRLWWTDFPAIESYGFEPGAIDVLNRMFLGERLPDGSEVVGELTPALLDLYRLRRHYEDTENPKVEKGFNGEGWNVLRTLPPHLAARWSEVGAVAFEDPRAIAYGHDVARVLMSRYAAEIKTQAKISDLGVLESNLRASILLSNTFANSRLAARILAWVSS